MNNEIRVDIPNSALGEKEGLIAKGIAFNQIREILEDESKLDYEILKEVRQIIHDCEVYVKINQVVENVKASIF